jgi:hypothetical protein
MRCESYSFACRVMKEVIKPIPVREIIGGQSDEDMATR